MRKNFFMKIALPLLAVLVLVAGGCNSALDDPDSNVILQVAVTDSPAIIGQFDEATGGCTYTITPWSADFSNLPKNASAITSPANDIVVRSWVVSYSWPDVPGVTVPPDRLLPSPGTIPANGEQTIEFEPIYFQDITGAMANTSAILTMTVDAVTESGEVIELVILEQLNIGCV